ncbi:hypothetical protein EDD11_001471 [Mortierella claussenii]|nr:hypothetical protein EDD11_001471 [Mortierella claussenii]
MRRKNHGVEKKNGKSIPRAEAPVYVAPSKFPGNPVEDSESVDIKMHVASQSMTVSNNSLIPASDSEALNIYEQLVYKRLRKLNKRLTRAEQAETNLKFNPLSKSSMPQEQLKLVESKSEIIVVIKELTDLSIAMKEQRIQVSSDENIRNAPESECHSKLEASKDKKLHIAEVPIELYIQLIRLFYASKGLASVEGPQYAKCKAILDSFSTLGFETTGRANMNEDPEQTNLQVFVGKLVQGGDDPVCSESPVTYKAIQEEVVHLAVSVEDGSEDASSPYRVEVPSRPAASDANEFNWTSGVTYAESSITVEPPVQDQSPIAMLAKAVENLPRSTLRPQGQSHTLLAPTASNVSYPHTLQVLVETGHVFAYDPVHPLESHPVVIPICQPLSQSPPRGAAVLVPEECLTTMAPVTVQQHPLQVHQLLSRAPPCVPNQIGCTHLPQVIPSDLSEVSKALSPLYLSSGAELNSMKHQMELRETSNASCLDQPQPRLQDEGHATCSSIHPSNQYGQSKEQPNYQLENHRRDRGRKQSGELSKDELGERAKDETTIKGQGRECYAMQPDEPRMTSQPLLPHQRLGSHPVAQGHSHGPSQFPAQSPLQLQPQLPLPGSSRLHVQPYIHQQYYQYPHYYYPGYLANYDGVMTARRAPGGFEGASVGAGGEVWSGEQYRLRTMDPIHEQDEYAHYRSRAG